MNKNLILVDSVEEVRQSFHNMFADMETQLVNHQSMQQVQYNLSTCLYDC